MVLEPDTVLATLYASKKYIVPSLAQACVDYLETSLSYKNACILLSQSRLFEENDLTQRCWEVNMMLKVVSTSGFGIRNCRFFCLAQFDMCLCVYLVGSLA